MASVPISERTQVFRSASLIGLLTLVSRVLGMARDVFSAAVFGAGAVWDAFIIAWTIPNLFRRLFGEGALASSFIPVYAEAVERGPSERPIKVLNGTLGSLLLVLGVIVVAGVGICYFLPAVLEGPGGDGKLTLTLRLTALLIPYLLFICITALFSAVLNVHRRFAASAAGPAVLNVIWIAGLAVAWWGLRHHPERRIYVVGVFLLVGGIAQVLVLLPQLVRKLGFPRPRPSLADPDVRRIGALALPVIFGLAILQLNVLADRLIAEFFVPRHGAVSALYYGNRLIQFPLGIIGIAVSTAAFPLFSRLAARGDLAGLKRVFRGALQGTFFLALPSAAGLILLSTPVVALLFSHGAFARHGATERTALVVALYAVGLPAYTLLSGTARVFHAMKDTRTPTRTAVFALVVNLALNLSLVWSLGEAGLALATSLTAFLQVFVLLFLLRGRIGFRPLTDLLRPAGKAVVSTAVMAVAVWLLWTFLPILRGEGLSARFARIAVVIGTGVAVYFGTALLLRDANLAVLRRGAFGRMDRGRPDAGAGERLPDGFEDEV